LWRRQFREGWTLLWTHRLRRDLDPIYRLIACRRGRHREAHVLADALVGTMLAQDYPEAAICEVCGRIVEWPNGTPHSGAPPLGAVAGYRTGRSRIHTAGSSWLPGEAS